MWGKYKVPGAATRDHYVNMVNISVSHNGTKLDFTFDDNHNATVEDLQYCLAQETGILSAHQKLIVRGKRLALDERLANLDSSRILLVGSKDSQIKNMNKSQQSHDALIARSSQPNPYAVRLYDQASSSSRFHTLSDASSQYTFHRIEPLQIYTEGIQTARNLLLRLASDPGIVSIMTNHQFSVGLLTEMDPAINTGASSKILGLNRNAGQIIELRLRTDRYDGFRHYNGIRTVLLHELTHNVHGEHDANFWKLFRELERELKAFEKDRKSGKRLGGDDVEVYRPDERAEIEEHVDSGRWVGGTFRLGGNESSHENEDYHQRVADAADKRAK